MTPGAVGLVRLVFWLLPLALGYLAARSWGRPRLVLGLLLAAALLGAWVKPLPLGWALAVLGFALGVPLGRR
ncbi:hypothetical protein [Oceanithermus sp.]|uniref:hypothetical protein n=1 Tax=Oceanithermus sp. TaxID=2268145 RepID=UPI00257D9611|nr:hypothetical protein [Oceanithermus sp.]